MMNIFREETRAQSGGEGDSDPSIQDFPRNQGSNGYCGVG